MMRYLRTYENYNDVSLDQVFEECSDIINELRSCEDKKLLYRGVRTKNISIEFRKVLNNGELPHRTPIDIPVYYHNEINGIFFEKFGWCVRDGVMCYTFDPTLDEKYIELGYGEKTYIMMPVNGYKYCWHPGIGDLYAWYEYEHEIDLDDPVDTSTINLVDGYKDNDICKARDNEISFHCDYYLIDQKFTDTILSKIYI